MAPSPPDNPAPAAVQQFARAKDRKVAEILAARGRAHPGDAAGNVWAVSHEFSHEQAPPR